jgi:hypothetical protein
VENRWGRDGEDCSDTVGMGIDRHLAAQAAGYRADVLHALEP